MAGTSLSDPEYMKAYALKDFYSGDMAPPTSVNGILHPTPSVNPVGNVGAGNHIYGEASQMTPGELARIINGDIAMTGYGNEPGGKGGKLPSFTPDDNMSAYARTGNGDYTALAAIAAASGGGVPLPRRDPRTGQVVTQPITGSPHISASDPWGPTGMSLGLRGGGSYSPIKGMVTGSSSGDAKAASIFTPAVMNAPITYSAPVAAGNFAAGSPNASFEKDHGMGSVTNSMASSSRWNTGY